LVRLWHLHDGGGPRLLQGHQRAVMGVSFSPDSTLLASAGGDGRVLIWRVIDGRRIRELSVAAETVPCVMFSPDGTLLAIGALDGSVLLVPVDAQFGVAER
jgi:WD40 repeat protein